MAINMPGIQSLGAFESYGAYYSNVIISSTPPEPAFMREFYRLLAAYYLQNGLYEFINKALRATLGSSRIAKPIRNPAWRVVEFYAAKTFPGSLPDDLPIITENEAIIEPIQRVWEWSNLSQKKQHWVRWFAIYGDWFIKVSSHEDPSRGVIASIIKPEHVTDFIVNERGHIIWIRMDVPILEGDKSITHTEVWSKGDQTLSIWRHTRGLDHDLDRLGPPDIFMPFSQIHGEDFIPIVYASFRDDGEGRAGGAYTQQLDKIDELNRQATRLAQIIYRYDKPLWVATTQAVDSSGRPMPAMNLDDLLTDGAFRIGDDDIITLPGLSDLKALVPNINYADVLAVLEANMGDLREDLPELSYYQLRDGSDLSGRALRYLLDDVISRVQEVRANAESALARVHEIALTIAQNTGVKGFDKGTIGTFSNRDFEHTFEPRPVLPTTIQDKAEIIEILARAGVGVFPAAKAAGFSDQEASELAQVSLLGALPGI